jgi:pSer/pThr/pTyr-binding forkhead associated (FHA) protein
VLSESYSAVTRISKPHGRIVRDKGAWFIEDSGSTGGTQVNNRRLEKNVRTPLNDGDLIELAKGVSGARLLVILPRDH